MSPDQPAQLQAVNVSWHANIRDDERHVTTCIEYLQSFIACSALNEFKPQKRQCFNHKRTDNFIIFYNQNT
ncbi:hypothetical protein ABMA08_18095 [Pseudomonas yamanorum]